MRCLNCFSVCSDREIEVNDGVCPYCGATEFEDVLDEENEQNGFGTFDEVEDELAGYDFSDIELDDDEDLFDGDFEDDLDFDDEDGGDDDER